MIVRRFRLVLTSVLLLGAMVGVTGCAATENIVGGVVDEARSGVDDAVGGVVDEARSRLDGTIDDLLGGAAISTDGEVPEGFPADAVPLTGEVLGGAAAPGAVGWVVRTRLSGADQFPVAQTAFEDAGYASSAVDSDADSGFGTFTSDTYRVVLTSSADADGKATATYVVTPV